MSMSSMKRTPRSARRRATRHCQPNPSGAAALEPVERERGVGLARKIERVGHFRLHAEGGFE